jgi:prevent-host-death family protein
MPITTISSRQFNQDASGAKKAANDGPVMITDRGEPAHVLLSIAEYRRLTGGDVFGRRVGPAGNLVGRRC